MDVDRVVTMAQVAEMLGVSRHRVYTLARNEELPGYFEDVRMYSATPNRAVARRVLEQVTWERYGVKLPDPVGRHAPQQWWNHPFHREDAERAVRELEVMAGIPQEDTGAG